MKEKPKNFEEAILELEQIAERLEKGSLSLEESILAYERGIELKKLCQMKLTEAEAKIESINKTEKETKKEVIQRKKQQDEKEALF